MKKEDIIIGNDYKANIPKLLKQIYKVRPVFKNDEGFYLVVVDDSNDEIPSWRDGTYWIESQHFVSDWQTVFGNLKQFMEVIDTFGKPVSQLTLKDFIPILSNYLEEFKKDIQNGK